jgi:hypothetical protein
VKAAHLPTPIVIAPGQELVSGRCLGKPRSHLSIEPGSLLLGSVHRQERPTAIRADVSRDNQQIALWDERKVTVLIAERDNPHLVILPL